MKIAIFGALAALAFASAAQAASPSATTVLSGYADVDYGYTNVHVSGLGGADVNAYGGKAAVAFPVMDDWGAQIDGAVNDFVAPGSFGGGSQTVASPSGHLFYRNDQWLAGGFVGGELAPHINLVGGGVEGQLYTVPNFVFEGAIADGGVDKSGAPNLWAGRIGGKDFITKNLSVGASVDYVNANGGGLSANLWTETLKGEYQLDSAPVALTLGYEHANLSRLSVSADSVLVGVRWSFGGGSLHDRETKGASLPSITDVFGGQAGQGLMGLVSAAYGSF
jgi:hypothetical protein